MAENSEGTVALEPEREVVTTVTPDIHNVSVKLQRAKDAYKDFSGIEEQPSNGEIILWYIYGLCSYFVHTVLIPIVFPLIISQTIDITLPQPPQGWNLSFKGLPCNYKELQVYQGLTYPSIEVSNYKFTPLEWTAISWAVGIGLSTPVLAYLSPHLDHGRNHNIIFGGATALGALFCLPTGFFKVSWIFPPYIAIIVVASMVGIASHTRHYGVMVRGFSDGDKHRHVLERGSVGSWLSLHATAAGSLGAAIISAFTFHMLHHSEKLISLWVVSIFSGLKWIIGTMHAFSVNRPGTQAIGADVSKLAHVFSVFKYPHAVGSLVAILLSSFTSNCIFTGSMLYILGQICVKPIMVLFLWLIYFIFPLFSLPVLHPLQQIAKTDAVRMQLLGFFMTATISGVGYHFRNANWQDYHLMIVVAILSTASGILHAFGRVLLLDCTPAKKEGSFSVWLAWVRAVGACAGFTVASVFPGRVSYSFGVTFLTSISAALILIFGNVSNNGGAIAAGHVRKEEGGEEGEVYTSLHVEA